MYSHTFLIIALKFISFVPIDCKNVPPGLRRVSNNEPGILRVKNPKCKIISLYFSKASQSVRDQVSTFNRVEKFDLTLMEDRAIN